MSCESCGEKKCCCVRVISKMGEKGKPGPPGPPSPSVGIGYNRIKFSPTPAQVKTAFSAPVIILPAPGVGKAIVVKSVFVRRKFVTTAYTSTGVLITSNPVSAAQAATSGNFLTIPAGGFAPKTSIAVNMMMDFNVPINVYENAPLYFEVGAADSLVGDDLITVWIDYSIITY